MQLPDGSMVDVPPVDGAFVVNLGDVMTLLTGNYFVATPHRVQARNDRFAIGFFYGPTLDTELAPLPLAPKFAAAVEASERHRTVGVMPRKDELVSLGRPSQPLPPRALGALAASAVTAQARGSCAGAPHTLGFTCPLADG